MIALLALPAIAIAADSQPTWRTAPPLPTPVIAPAASVSGDLFIVTGGITANGSVSTAVQVLDTAMMTWTQPPPLLAPRFMHGQITLDDGRTLIVGGQNLIGWSEREGLVSCELRDATGGMPMAAPDLPREMRTPTLHTLADGRVVAIGGRHACVFDPTSNQWTQTVVLNEKRLSHTSVLLDDSKLLVIGGNRRDTIERVDLVAGTSELLKVRLPHAIDDLVAVPTPEDAIWIIGGQNSATGDTTSQTWLLSIDAPAGQVLRSGPRLPTARGVADPILVEVEDGYLLLGGESQTDQTDRELTSVFFVDPEALEIHRLPAMGTPHDDAVAARVGDRVIAAGGQVTKRKALFFDMPAPVAAVEVLEAGEQPPGRLALLGRRAARTTLDIITLPAHALSRPDEDEIRDDTPADPGPRRRTRRVGPRR